MRLSDVLTFVIPLVFTIAVAGGAIYLVGRNNRDARIIILAMALFSILILSSEFISRLPLATGGSTPQVTSTPVTVISKNIPLACSDCQQQQVATTLIAIIVPQGQAGLEDVTLRFQFTNTTAAQRGLQFSAINLTDPSGNDHPGQADPFLVSSDQPTIENVIFHGLQSHVQYTLKMVVVQPDTFQNFYQPVTVTF